MDVKLVLLLVAFLVTMAGLAGIGIGILLGLVLGSREDKTPRSLPIPTPESTSPVSARANVVTPDRLPSDVSSEVLKAPARRMSVWSVIIAVAMIIFCCCCTFLVASLATIGQR